MLEVLVRVSWKVDLGSSGYRLFGGFLFVLQLLLQHDKNFLNNFEQKFTYLFNLAATLFLHLKTNAIVYIGIWQQCTQMRTGFLILLSRVHFGD